MSEFVNTIDELGEAVAMVKLLDRTLVEFKDNVLTTVGTYAFGNCTALIAVDLPNVTNLGSNAFYSCSSLASVNLPMVTTTGTYAFGYCSSLTTIDLPRVTSFDMMAFSGCSSLTALILRSTTMCTLGSYNFDNTPIKFGTGYIYVPSSLVSSYKSATNWSTYASQFRALENYTVDGTITGALDETKI